MMPGEIVQGLSGEAVKILQKPGTSLLHLEPALAHDVDLEVVRKDLQRLYDDGYRAIAVVLAHSYVSFVPACDC